MNRKIIQEIFFVVVRIVVIVAFIYAGLRATTFCYEFGFKIFADEAIDPAPGITKTVAVVDGKTDKEIGEALEEKGLIKDAFLFRFQVKFSEFDGKLKPGVYELSTAMTPYDMMRIMSRIDEENVDDSEEITNVVNDGADFWSEADDIKNDTDEATGGNDGE